MNHNQRSQEHVRVFVALMKRRGHALEEILQLVREAEAEANERPKDKAS